MYKLINTGKTMAQTFSYSLIKKKTSFAENFLASVERDRRAEEKAGTVDPQVERRRTALFTFATVGLEPEPHAET